MIDLIGTNPIFSSAIRLVIAQRLVRKLDENKQEYQPDEATRIWVQTVLKGVNSDYLPQDIQGDFKLWQAVPTVENPFGYKGRTVIMEQMVVDENIQAFLRGDIEDIHAEIIENQARKNGMLTLLQQGVLAALRGETSLDEINRVI